MANRYTSFFRIPDNLYEDNAPVIVKAGALLKDNTSGNIFAQLKIKNISDKTIQSLTVRITPHSVNTVTTLPPITYTYENLNAEFDSYFGSKELIKLTGTTIDSYSLNVDSVSFVDGSKWHTTVNNSWSAVNSENNDILAESYQQNNAKREKALKENQIIARKNFINKIIWIPVIITTLAVIFVFCAAHIFMSKYYLHEIIMSLFALALPLCFIILLKYRKSEHLRLLFIITVVALVVQLLGMVYCSDPFSPKNPIKNLLGWIGGCNLVYYGRILPQMMKYLTGSELHWALRTDPGFVLFQTLAQFLFIAKNISILIFSKKIMNIR